MRDKILSALNNASDGPECIDYNAAADAVMEVVRENAVAFAEYMDDWWFDFDKYIYRPDPSITAKTKGEIYTLYLESLTARKG